MELPQNKKCYLQIYKHFQFRKRPSNKSEHGSIQSKRIIADYDNSNNNTDPQKWESSDITENVEHLE